MNDTINTIFYFVKDFDTYEQKLDAGKILAKTIVFVENEKAIYKNGVRYGNMSDTDFRNKVTEVMNSDTVIQGLINEIYDDQWIRDWMAQVDQTITSEQNRLSGVIRDLDADIQAKVEKWSTIRQDISNIQASINALSSGIDGRFTALDSSLKLYTDTQIQTAVAELSTTYATGTDLDGVKTVLEWMYSGLKSSAGPDKSVAQIIAAGKSALLNQMGISELRTFVENVPEQGYVATSSLQSQVEQIMDNTTTALVTAGLINQASLAGALSALYARSEQPENQIAGWSQLMLDVSTGNDGKFVTKAGLITSIGNKLDATNDPNGDNMAVLTSAGIVAQSTLDTSVAALFAQNNNSGTKAAIEAVATDVASSITLTADQVDARVNQFLISGNATVKGDVQASQFIAGGNGEAGIVIQGGYFDSDGADVNKIYIAMDSNEGAPNMFIHNHSTNKWMSLSFSNAFNTGIFHVAQYALFNDGNSYTNIIPDNTLASSITGSNFQLSTIYRSHDNNLYYTQENANPSNLVQSSFLNWTSIPSFAANTHQGVLQYLGTDSNGRLILGLVSAIQIPQYITFVDGLAGNDSGRTAIYSPNAITSCTISGGTITSVTRGPAFLKVRACHATYANKSQVVNNPWDLDNVQTATNTTLGLPVDLYCFDGDVRRADSVLMSGEIKVHQSTQGYTYAEGVPFYYEIANNFADANDSYVYTMGDGTIRSNTGASVYRDAVLTLTDLPLAYHTTV